MSGTFAKSFAGVLPKALTALLVAQAPASAHPIQATAFQIPKPAAAAIGTGITFYS